MLGEVKGEVEENGSSHSTLDGRGRKPLFGTNGSGGALFSSVGALFSSSGPLLETAAAVSNIGTRGSASAIVVATSVSPNSSTNTKRNEPRNKS